MIMPREQVRSAPVIVATKAPGSRRHACVPPEMRVIGMFCPDNMREKRAIAERLGY